MSDWVMVPREPTEEMLDVFHDRILIQCRPDRRDAVVLNDREVYSAMIAAVPAQPAQEPSDVDAAYDRLDHFLRNNLDDADYADYSSALETVYTRPPAALPAYCATDGTCACAKFHDDPTHCHRRLERGQQPALPDGWFMTAMYLVKRYAVAAKNGNSDMAFLYQSLRDHLKLAEGR